MISTYDKFVRLLQLEIESLHDEIELIVASLDRRLERREITDYVRNENVAILRNELLGLEDFLRTEFATSDRGELSLDEVVIEVQEYLRRRIADRGYVPALYELVRLRIRKIVDYLRSTSPASAS